MQVLFDNGTPRGVAAALRDHVIEECRSRGWDSLRNGELLDAAEAAGFDVLVTTDRNIRHQQSLTGRKIAVVILRRPLEADPKPSRGDRSGRDLGCTRYFHRG